MNKGELVHAISAQTQVSQKQVDAILSAIVDTIGEAVAAGDKVVLSGFGSFESRERSERAGRNPKTGKEITIPATKVPGFAAGKVFKDKVKATT